MVKSLLQENMYHQVYDTLQSLLGEALDSSPLRGDSKSELSFSDFLNTVSAELGTTLQGNWPVRDAIAPQIQSMGTLISSAAERYGIDPLLFRSVLSSAWHDTAPVVSEPLPSVAGISSGGAFGQPVSGLDSARALAAYGIAQNPAVMSAGSIAASLPEGGYVVGVDKRPWEKVDAPIRGVPGVANPDLYAAVLQQFGVESNPRYAQNQQGRGDTYCNIYVWDATRAMGVEVPYWTDDSGNPTAPGVGQAMDANRMTTWLDTHGAAYGWHAVGEQDAQALANQGLPVVAAWRNPSGIGHVAMVRPGEYSAEEGPLLAQAGNINSSAVRVKDTFWTGWKSGDLKFFVNGGTQQGSVTS